MSEFNDNMSLAAARDALEEAILEGGTECPCCRRLAKLYSRAINSSQARGLIALYKAYGRDFGYLQDVRRAHGQTDNREESKLRYWGLVEEEPTRRPDGGRAGWWRVTRTGEEWVMGNTSVPRYAQIYASECLGLTGEPVTIFDALGEHFNYRELMNS
jgi:hypothetical protein